MIVADLFPLSSMIRPDPLRLTYLPNPHLYQLSGNCRGEAAVICGSGSGDADVSAGSASGACAGDAIPAARPWFCYVCIGAPPARL